MMRNQVTDRAKNHFESVECCDRGNDIAENPLPSYHNTLLTRKLAATLLIILIPFLLILASAITPTFAQTPTPIPTTVDFTCSPTEWTSPGQVGIVCEPPGGVITGSGGINITGDNWQFRYHGQGSQGCYFHLGAYVTKRDYYSDTGNVGSWTEYSAGNVCTGTGNDDWNWYPGTLGSWNEGGALGESCPNLQWSLDKFYFGWNVGSPYVLDGDTPAKFTVQAHWCNVPSAPAPTPAGLPYCYNADPSMDDRSAWTVGGDVVFAGGAAWFGPGASVAQTVYLPAGNYVLRVAHQKVSGEAETGLMGGEWNGQGGIGTTGQSWNTFAYPITSDGEEGGLEVSYSTESDGLMEVDHICIGLGSGQAITTPVPTGTPTPTPTPPSQQPVPTCGAFPAYPSPWYDISGWLQWIGLVIYWLWCQLSVILTMIYNAIVALYDILAGIVTDILEAIQDALEWLWTTYLEAMLQSIVDAIEGIVSGITSLFQDVIDAVLAFLADPFGALQDVIDAITAFLADPFGVLTAWFEALWTNTIAPFLTNLMEAIGLGDLLDWFNTNILPIIQDFATYAENAFAWLEYYWMTGFNLIIGTVNLLTCDLQYYWLWGINILIGGTGWTSYYWLWGFNLIMGYSEWTAYYWLWGINILMSFFDWAAYYWLWGCGILFGFFYQIGELLGYYWLWGYGVLFGFFYQIGLWLGYYWMWGANLIMDSVVNRLMPILMQFPPFAFLYDIGWVAAYMIPLVLQIIQSVWSVIYNFGYTIGELIEAIIDGLLNPSTDLVIDIESSPLWAGIELVNAVLAETPYAYFGMIAVAILIIRFIMWVMHEVSGES